MTDAQTQRRAIWESMKDKRGDAAAREAAHTQMKSIGESTKAKLAQVLSADELAKLNGTSASRMLQLGDTIKLPAGANIDSSATQAKADSKDKKRSKTATTSYTIKRGDTLNSIARKFEVDINELAGMNGIPANTLVRVGDSIEVPELAPKTVDYVVRRGDTLARVANKHGVTLAQLAELNEIPTDAKLQAGDTLSVPNPKNGTDR